MEEKLRDSLIKIGLGSRNEKQKKEKPEEKDDESSRTSK